jgi:hypothetical protein
MQAQVLKTKLETVGIPVILQYESAGLVFGLTVDGLGEVRIMVPKEFEQEALAAIEPDEPLSEDDWQGQHGEESWDEDTV